MTAAARNSDFIRTLLLAPGLGDRALRELSSRSISGSFEGETSPRLFGREGRLLAGAELAREWLDTAYRPVGAAGEIGGRSGVARGARDRFAAFLLQELNVSPRVRITSGLRWDYLEEDFGAERPTHEALSPRLGINLRVGSLDGPASSVSRAFKAPTLDQLYDPRPRPDFQGGTFQLSNPTLSPQRAWNLELGAFREVRDARVELSLYWMEVEDEIDFDAATLRYSNIGESLHRGAEASFQYRFSMRVSSSLLYAWTRAEPRQGGNRGKQLKNIPEHMVRAGLDADLPGAVRVSVSYALAAERYLDDANDFRMADAGTLELRLEREFHRWSVRLDLLNLTDEEYPQLGFALPDFEGDAALYEYPAPRFAARAGVDVKF